MAKLFFLCFWVIVLATPSWAVLYQAPAGWSIDLPDGFKENGQGTHQWQFSSTSSGCEVVIQPFSKNRYSSLTAMVADFLKSQNLQAELIKVNENAGLVEVTTSTERRVIGAFFYQPERESYLVKLTAQESFAGPQEIVWASLIDSFCTSPQSYLSPGILSALDAKQTPPGLSSAISFGGEILEAAFSKGLQKNSEALIDRETKVLLQVKGDHFEAMSRFYRMIFRQAYPSFNALEGNLRAYFNLKKMSDQEKIGFLCSALYLFPSEALNGVEGNKIIESPISVLTEGHGDCDSKALTLNLLLTHLGLDGQMLVSLPDQHALIGLPPKYFTSKQEVFTKSTKGDWLVAIELLQDPAKQIFLPENWKAVELLPFR